MEAVALCHDPSTRVNPKIDGVDQLGVRKSCLLLERKGDCSGR